MNNIKAYLHIFCFLFLLGGFSSPILAQNDANEESFAVRKFDPDRLKSNRDNSKYQYHRDKPEPPNRKSKPRKYRKVRDINAPEIHAPRGDFSGLAKGIFWVFIVGIFIFVVFQLMKVNFKSLFKKRSDKAKVIAVDKIEEAEEDIHKMEFEDLVQQAIDQGRFRVAVRLLYLRTLRLLSEQSLIQWRHEKTNHEYLRELSDASLRPLFGDVTLIFEYTWYGEVPVDKDEFNLARASFLQFEQTLRTKYAV